MDVVQATLVLLGLLSAFAAYHLLTAVPFPSRARRRAHEQRRDEDPPRVTFLLTAYREGEGVLDCLRALLALDHPPDRLHVIVVADEDAEGTGRAVRAFAIERGGRALTPLGDPSAPDAEPDDIIEAPQLTIVIQRGASVARGKPRALQNGLRYASSEGFIGVMDGDHIIARDFLTKTLPLFDDPRVGIVQAARAPKDADACWLTTWDVFEQNIAQVQNQIVRGTIGCASFYGSTGIVRADVLTRLGWENSLAEDTFLNYEVRELGYRVAFTTETGSVEDHVGRVRHYVRQRRRWAAGHTHVLAAKLGILRRSSLSFTHRLEAAFHLTYYLMGLVLLQYWLLRATYYWSQSPDVQIAPILGASLLVGLAVAYGEGSVDGRLRSRWNGFLVAGALSFAVLSLVAAAVRPPDVAFPVPAGLEALLFLAPLVQMVTGYADARLRPPTTSRRVHVKRWTIVAMLAVPMLFVNLYASLTGMLLSLESRPSWVKTTRRSHTSST